jgi:hypothetical protein
MRLFVIFCLAVLFRFPLFAQSQDELAIQTLLENETKDFLVIPLSEIVKKYWKVDDQTLLILMEPDGQLSELNSDILLSIKDLPFPSETEIIKTEHFIHINGNNAFASHEQIFVDKKTRSKIFSHEIRVLEKVDGAWKIHVSNVHQYKKG